MSLCSGISTKFSFAELDPGVELGCDVLLLDEDIILEDKDLEESDAFDGAEDTATLFVADDCALLETTGAIELCNAVDDPDEAPPPPPHAQSDIVKKIQNDLKL